VSSILCIYNRDAQHLTLTHRRASPSIPEPQGSGDSTVIISPPTSTSTSDAITGSPLSNGISGGKQGLSAGAGAGIGIGATLVAVTIILLLFWRQHRGRRASLTDRSIHWEKSEVPNALRNVSNHSGSPPSSEIVVAGGDASSEGAGAQEAVGDDASSVHSHQSQSTNPHGHHGTGSHTKMMKTATTDNRRSIRKTSIMPPQPPVASEQPTPPPSIHVPSTRSSYLNIAHSEQQSQPQHARTASSGTSGSRHKSRASLTYIPPTQPVLPFATSTVVAGSTASSLPAAAAAAAAVTVEETPSKRHNEHRPAHEHHVHQHRPQAEIGSSAGKSTASGAATRKESKKKRK
jgi:hypothetical protein